ncbi:hypothetical protein VTK56DRAFT_3072 [Thermocarpiscus australiensis]
MKKKIDDLWAEEMRMIEHVLEADLNKMKTELEHHVASQYQTMSQSLRKSTSEWLRERVLGENSQLQSVVKRMTALELQKELGSLADLGSQMAALRLSVTGDLASTRKLLDRNDKAVAALKKQAKQPQQTPAASSATDKRIDALEKQVAQVCSS